MKTNPRPAHGGYTFTELLVALCIVTVLFTVVFVVVKRVRLMANIAVSTSQLHGLVAANGAYAADNMGEFCPAMSADNLTRWHGGRRSLDDEFDPDRGFLSPYLGGSKRLLTCPLLVGCNRDSFEKGAGGYGYNAQYIGGTPGRPFAGAAVVDVPSLGGVVMFATTALATDRGLQEYPFTEPYHWVDRRGRLRGQLQPSTHFRADGKAIVAWGDGTVTLEAQNGIDGPNFYGGNNRAHHIGWFGPDEKNGYWNPQAPVVTHRK